MKKFPVPRTSPLYEDALVCTLLREHDVLSQMLYEDLDMDIPEVQLTDRAIPVQEVKEE